MNIRRLYICNNPYQVIIAILLAKQLHNKGDSREIILTDNFNGAKMVFENLENNSFFDEVYFAHINEILFPKTIMNKSKKVLGIFSVESFIESTIDNNILDKKHYDEIYYNNDDIFLYNLISYCLKRNNRLKVFRFEEGYSSYLRPFCSLRAQSIFDNRYKDITFKKLLCGMYYFYPDQILFQKLTYMNKIERHIDSEVIELIRTAFSITDILDETISNRKYIIFEESFFQDYGYNADVQFYQRIIKKLGPENFIMKLHPRSKINRFKDLGIKFIENADVPWEAILVLNDFKNIKFVTLASGSVINSRLMLGDSTESFLLYKCIRPSVPTLNDEFDKFVVNFEKTCGEKLYIPTSVEEFYSII